MKLFVFSARCVAPLVVAIALLACTTTPDLSGWAQNSADLAGAIAGENKIVIDRITADIALARVGSTEKWRDLGDNPEARWKEKLETYQLATIAMERTLDGMVKYAEELSELAAKGETGREAAKQIFGSVDTIVKAISQANPVTDAARKVVEELSAAWTKVEAQDSLAETMEAIQPTVDKLAELVRAYADNHKEIARVMWTFEQHLLEGRAGPARMTWWESGRYGEVEGVFGQGHADRRAAYATLLDQVQPAYAAYQQSLDESSRWLDDRVTAADRVKDAANAWRDAHSKAKDILVACGGLRSLRPACGNFTAANLKLAAERIRNVISPPKASGTGASSPATPGQP